jgi:hypothetical protein
MFPFAAIFLQNLEALLYVLIQPEYWLILLFVAYQFWQQEKQQLAMFGQQTYKLKNQVGLTVLYGFIGGIIGSNLLSLIGLTLNDASLDILWMVAIGLMLVQGRFICFAYAGGLIALSSLIFGWPYTNVPQLLALVAVLHLIESLLIAISGRYASFPMLLKKADGQVVGAFNLQNFWPLPLAMLLFIVAPEGYQQGVTMPEWWPLIKSFEATLPGAVGMYAILPVFAALGYTDIAVTRTPEQRRRRSSMHLLVYSTVLLAVALASAQYLWLQYVAALLAPLGHELLIKLDQREEMQGKPLFVAPDIGVMLLSTLHCSPAAKAGLQAGDVIMDIAGQPIKDIFDFNRVLREQPPRIVMGLQRRDERLSISIQRGDDGFIGIILIPTTGSYPVMVISQDAFWIITLLKTRFYRFREWWKKR